MAKRGRLRQPSEKLQELMREVKKQDEDFKLGSLKKDDVYQYLGDIMEDLKGWRRMAKELNDKNK